MLPVPRNSQIYAFALFALFLLVEQGESFTPNAPPRSVVSKTLTQLHQSSIPREDSQSASPPAWINRPIKRQEQDPWQRFADATELSIGRTAMLFSVILFTQELMTG